MYDTALLLFGQSADFRKLWFHLKPESCGNWVKITLVDDEGKPLKNVDSLGDHDSEDKVESVDNKMARFLASKKDGYGTNSLVEQWKETYENADYDYDPYDDDMYEGQEVPDKIQSISDNLDIKV
nr:L10-interacting MYB domain-containing protein-like [Tanacetum cinerariifolium]